MNSRHEVAILGGGLIGRLLAWHLAKNGCTVSLYEAGSRNGDGAAAYVAAAMLAPMAEAIDGTPLAIKLGYESQPLWKSWISTWSEPVFMQENGSLVVWHAQDKALALQFMQHLKRAHQQRQTWQDWASNDIARLEPQLAGRFSSGIFLPTEGQLDNRQVLSALASELEHQGVDCHWQQPKNICDIQNDADWVIDCRGYGAKDDWNHVKPAGSHLRGVRGEVLRVWAPEVSLNRPVRLLHPRYPLYIAPKQDHIFVIGATQIESEDNDVLTVRSGLELMSALYAVHPAFGEARVLETGVNLRPTLNHENPEIRYDKQARIVAVNGLFRHGFMISPVVSVVVSNVIHALLNRKELPNEEQRHDIPLEEITYSKDGD